MFSTEPGFILNVVTLQAPRPTNDLYDVNAPSPKLDSGGPAIKSFIPAKVWERTSFDASRCSALS